MIVDWKTYALVVVNGRKQRLIMIQSRRRRHRSTIECQQQVLLRRKS